MKPWKISAHSDKHSGDIFFTGDKSCELKFSEVSGNDSKIKHSIMKSKRCWNFQSSILTNKKVLFLKKYEVYHVPWIALFSANRWYLDVLTFLIKGFSLDCNNEYRLGFCEGIFTRHLRFEWRVKLIQKWKEHHL